MLLIQALPLLVLLALLASGRAGPVVACLAALAATLPAIRASLPPDATVGGYILAHTLEGAFLAASPVGIVLGGLLFHAVARGEGGGGSRRGDIPGVLFASAFLLGLFAESVTGFGVGMVFTIGALREVGVTGAPAAAIGLMSQALIIWGGLGPGTALGAALAGLPAQAIAQRNSWQAAPWLLLLVPLFWRLAARAGHPVPTAARPAQLAWVAALAALLIAACHALPWEVAGLLAAGPPLLARLWRDDPPRSAPDWRRAARAIFPYALLTAALLAGRAWTGAPAFHPYPGLPALGLGHPLVALWTVSLILLVARRRDGAWSALRRGRRPALVILLYVILARWLIGTGAPTALAAALEGALGDLAPYAAPFVAALSGFIAGTNVGSNSIAMTLQAALGRLHGLDPVLLPAVQNFVGAAVLLLSPQVVGIAAGLAGERRAAPIWRLVWPIVPIALAIGLVSVAIG